MKNWFYFCIDTNSKFDTEDAYAAGEWFKFRIHYGIVNAGYLTLEVKMLHSITKKLSRSREGYTTECLDFF
jgi:hypothetical protein